MCLATEFSHLHWRKELFFCMMSRTARAEVNQLPTFPLVSVFITRNVIVRLGFGGVPQGETPSKCSRSSNSSTRTPHRRRVSSAVAAAPAAEDLGVTGWCVDQASRTTWRTRLLSPSRASLSTNLLGHLLASDDCVRRHDVARSDDDTTKTKDMTFLESKLIATPGSGATSVVGGELSTRAPELVTGDSPDALQYQGAQGGRYSPDDKPHRRQEEALGPSPRKHRHEVAKEERAENDVRTPWVDEGLQGEQPKRTLVTQHELLEDCTESKGRKKVFEEEHGAPLSAITSSALGAEKGEHSAEGVFEHPCISSTTVRRQGSVHGGANNCKSSPVESFGSGDGTDISSSATSSRASGRSLAQGPVMNRTNVDNKRNSIEESSSDGEKEHVAKIISGRGRGDELDTDARHIGSVSGSPEKDHVKQGSVLAAVTSANLPGSTLSESCSAGRGLLLSGDVVAEGSPHVLSRETSRTGVEPLHPDDSAAASLPVLSVPHDNKTRHPPFSAAGPVSGSSAASPTPASASVEPCPVVERLKKRVGDRLSEMIRVRCDSKTPSGARKGIFLPRQHPRSTAEKSIHFGTDAFASPQTSQAPPCSIAHKLPKSLLLRQLRRQTAVQGQHRPAANAALAKIRGGQQDVTTSLSRADSAGGKISGTGRKAGVLREITRYTNAGKGRSSEAGNPVGASSVKVGGTAVPRRGARRVTTAGVSHTSTGGSGPVKMVRFGSMSVHVYAREACIRSGSSDSLSAAGGLAPANCFIERSRPYNFAERPLARARGNTNYGRAHKVEEENWEEDEEEEDEDEDEEQEDQEKAGQCERPCGDDAFRGVTTAEKEHIRGADETYGAANTRDRPPGYSHDSNFQRGVTKSSTGDKDAVATAAAAAELEAHTHYVQRGSSGSTANFTVDRYPTEIEDLYGRPDTVPRSEQNCEKSGVAVQARPEPDSSKLLNLSVTDVANADFSGTTLDRRPASEKESEPAVDRAAIGGLRPSSARAGFRAHEDANLCGTCVLGSPLAPSGELAHFAPGSSNRSGDAAPTDADWWKRVLSSSSSNIEGRFPPGDRRERLGIEHEQPDRYERRKSSVTGAPRDVAHVVRAGQVITASPVVAACIATGDNSAILPPTAGEAVGKEGGLCVQAVGAGNREEEQSKRISSVSPTVGVTQEANISYYDTKRVLEGRNIVMQPSSKTVSQKKPGWSELWTQEGARKGASWTENLDCVPQSRLLAPYSRRLHSDGYTSSGSDRTQMPRRPSEGVVQQADRGENISPLPVDSKSSLTQPTSKGLLMLCGPEAERTRCTDESSPPCVLQIRDGNSQDYGHEEQQHLQGKTSYGGHSAQSPEEIKLLTDLENSTTCTSCVSTVASSDLGSKSNSLGTVKDLTSRSSTAGWWAGELLAQQDSRNSTDSKNEIGLPVSGNLSSFARTHFSREQDPSEIKRSTFAETAAEHHDVAHGSLHQLLVQSPSSQQEIQQEGGPPRRRPGSRGSLSSMSSAGRSSATSTQEEVLDKAAEEVIARSPTLMSAEEKENLKGIIRGWCS